MIDAKTIAEVNDRLTWDGRWEKSVPRISQDDKSIEEVLDLSFSKLIVYPKLIIVSWSIGIDLLKQNHKDFFQKEKIKFQRNLEAEKQNLLELGYIGDFKEVPVIASIYLETWGNIMMIVASTPNPKEIDYKGSNCLLIYLND